MAAYYNEHDSKAAAWLRELIKGGHIAHGEVDERSIVDVQPADLRGFTQCHFFAGIGGWSYALRLAGWLDDEPVWTGSCPCQPLSVAGQRKGHADQRHLWPAFYRLIAELRPPVVFGEQVASKDGREWFAAVRADLEGSGYACGGADLCAAGVGAPHIRQRLYFVADIGSVANSESIGWHSETAPSREGGWWAAELGLSSSIGELADAAGIRCDEPCRRQPGEPQEEGRLRELAGIGVFGELADASGLRPQEGEKRWEQQEKQSHGQDSTGGFWADADWLPCTDGKARPIESATERLADGLSDLLGLVRLESYPDRPHEERLIYAPLIQKGQARIMRLRGYGNAIVPQVAAEFINAYREAVGENHP